MPESELRSRVVARDGLVVTGPGAAAFLQGQLTQEVEQLAVGSHRLSLVLSPQGRVDSFCRVAREGDEAFLLDTEAGFGEALAARLARFKLRVAATIEPVDLVATERLGGGLDRFDAPERRRPATAELAAATSAEDLFELDRIEQVVPRLGRELTTETIPFEVGRAFVAQTVSFDKGCYTGQELVARMDARQARPPRELRLALAAAGAAPEHGALLMVGGETVGSVTSSASRPGGGFAALVLVRRRFLGADDCVEASVTGGDGGGIPVTVQPGVTTQPGDELGS